MKQNLMLNKKSPNSKLNFCFDPLPYLSAEQDILNRVFQKYNQYIYNNDSHYFTTNFSACSPGLVLQGCPNSEYNVYKFF